MQKFVLAFFSCMLTGSLLSQSFPTGSWRAELIREDGKTIPFIFEAKDSAGKNAWFIRNAGERLWVDSILVKGDSVWVQMPFFDSYIRARLVSGNKLQGQWIKRLELTEAVMPFSAVHNVRQRFAAPSTAAAHNISGRWSVDFVSSDQKDTTHSVGEFLQKGNLVTGTFLNPTGDYRYLEGVLEGDSLKMSCFDGGHAYLFTAVVSNNETLS